MVLQADREPTTFSFENASAAVFENQVRLIGDTLWSRALSCDANINKQHALVLRKVYQTTKSWITRNLIGAV